MKLFPIKIVLSVFFSNIPIFCMDESDLKNELQKTISSETNLIDQTRAALKKKIELQKMAKEEAKKKAEQDRLLAEQEAERQKDLESLCAKTSCFLEVRALQNLSSYNVDKDYTRLLGILKDPSYQKTHLNDLKILKQASTTFPEKSTEHDDVEDEALHAACLNLEQKISQRKQREKLRECCSYCCWTSAITTFVCWGPFASCINTTTRCLGCGNSI